MPKPGPLSPVAAAVAELFAAFFLILGLLTPGGAVVFPFFFGLGLVSPFSFLGALDAPPGIFGLGAGVLLISFL